VRFPAAPAGAVAEVPIEAVLNAGHDRPTVLVIDDDRNARTLMRRHLTRAGYRVEEAADGPSGLAQARAVHPAVITLDAIMPGMDGWAVLSALKSDPELAAIPVVMATTADEEQLGFALGASEYLTKPIDKERLLAALGRCASEVPGAEVLVVEDDQPARTLMARALRRAGWVVSDAENGRVALDRMRQHLPAVILLDLMMPEMDGFQFLSAIRAESAWREVPVIVITAKILTDDDRRRLNGGVAAVVRKSGRPPGELVAEVTELVRARAPIVGRSPGAPVRSSHAE
jgi:CheY-like chemotaxis protein